MLRWILTRIPTIGPHVVRWTWVPGTHVVVIVIVVTRTRVANVVVDMLTRILIVTRVGLSDHRIGSTGASGWILVMLRMILIRIMFLWIFWTISFHHWRQVTLFSSNSHVT